jgi:hypothetical protein
MTYRDSGEAEHGEEAAEPLTVICLQTNSPEKNFYGVIKHSLALASATAVKSTQHT